MKKLLNTTLLLILMLIGAAPALAQEGHERPGQVIFGSDLRLEQGDIINGDVVIFGGSLRMAEGSRIEGDAVVFGGRGEINGEVEGDTAFIGGDVRLGPTAKVDGDVASVGGTVLVDEAANVRGQVIETTRFDLSRIPLPPIIPIQPVRPVPPELQFDRGVGYEPANQFFRIVLASARGLLAALVISAIGLLVVLFLPEHTQIVGQAINQSAPGSFVVGLLTLIIGTLAIVLVVATCCLLPVGLLLALALVLATLFGWIVVGYLLGGRILRVLQKNNDEPTPVAAALAGIFVVTLVQQGLMALSHLPCLGFFFWLLGALLWLLIVSTGLGAVVLTRFGTQVYTRTPPARTPPPPLPPTPPPPPSVPPPAPTDVEAPDDAEPGSSEETSPGPQDKAPEASDPGKSQTDKPEEDTST
jgi:cytoskeletal protein CcmA (bactofilin family)